jgi:hypothetical protein
MATEKRNGLVKWVVVALAVGGLIFNSGILYNDVKHVKDEIAEVKQEIKELRVLFTEMR